MKMVQFEERLTLDGGSSGDAVAELNRLIAARSKVLNQTTFQATAAVAQNALKSIRAKTQDAKKRKKFKITVELTSYVVGFSKTDRKPCLRASAERNATKVIPPDGKVVFLTTGIVNAAKNAHVFKVVQEHDGVRPLYIACRTQGEAEQYALSATQWRIENKGTLAKNALGVAMSKVAAKSMSLDGSNKSRNLASQAATIIENKSGGDYTLRVEDNLDYASDALKGGAGALNTALQAAANKVWGTLAHLAGIDFVEEFPDKPFPEINRKV